MKTYPFKKECATPRNGSRIPVSDAKSSTMYFANPHNWSVLEVRIDKCQLTDHDPVKRCDYLLIAPDGTEHFVELKGADIEKAFKQLEASIRMFSRHETARKAYVVFTRSLPSTSTIRTKAEIRFDKDLKTKLVVVRHNAECSLSL